MRKHEKEEKTVTNKKYIFDIGSKHVLWVYSGVLGPWSRYITLLTPEDENIKPKEEESVDLRTLRAIRVLRPLKLVSGVPSKCFYK